MNNITVLLYFAWHKYRSDYFYIYLRDNLKNVKKILSFWLVVCTNIFSQNSAI